VTSNARTNEGPPVTFALRAAVTKAVRIEGCDRSGDDDRDGDGSCAASLPLPLVAEKQPVSGFDVGPRCRKHGRLCFWLRASASPRFV